MQLTLLYFAQLKEAFGTHKEIAEVPAHTVAELLDQLRTRGSVWQEELAPIRPYQVAVNQRLATPTTTLSPGDEVAIFPPVTGG